VDTTDPNVDESGDVRLKLPAADKSGTLRDLRPEPYPEGNELLSGEIDAIVYR
jgi:hypothetical protein